MNGASGEVLGIFDEDLYYREVYLPILADLGVQHVVVIARGRPLTDEDINCVAGAADHLAGFAHTPG